MTPTTPTPALADLDKPEIEQEWAKVDPATAFHLIERHAEDWADAGRMMEAWRKANSSDLAPSPQIAEVAELPPLPEMLGAADMGAVLDTPEDWDADYRATWRNLQIAECNKRQWRAYALQLRDAIAASRRAAGGDLRNEIEMVSGALELCEPEEQAAFKLIVQKLNGGQNG